MVTLPDLWMPSPLSRAEGKEIEKLSLLGPFLSLSVFSEDCVSFRNLITVHRTEVSNEALLTRVNFDMGTWP